MSKPDQAAICFATFEGGKTLVLPELAAQAIMLASKNNQLTIDSIAKSCGISKQEVKCLFKQLNKLGLATPFEVETSKDARWRPCPIYETKPVKRFGFRSLTKVGDDGQLRLLLSPCNRLSMLNAEAFGFIEQLAKAGEVDAQAWVEKNYKNSVAICIMLVNMHTQGLVSLAKNGDSAMAKVNSFTRVETSYLTYSHLGELK